MGTKKIRCADKRRYILEFYLIYMLLEFEIRPQNGSWGRIIDFGICIIGLGGWFSIQGERV